MRLSIAIVAGLLCVATAGCDKDKKAPVPAKPALTKLVPAKPAPAPVPATAAVVLTEAQAGKAACESMVRTENAIRTMEQSTLTKQMIATGAVQAAAPHNDYSAYAKMNRPEMRAAIDGRVSATRRWMKVMCPSTPLE